MRPTASTTNKQSPNAIGIDDGPFTKQQDTAPLVAVLLQGPHLQKVRTGWITVDGLDATDKALKLLKGWKPVPILLSGVTYAGFNLIDPHVLRRKLRVPVIIVVGSQPDNKAVKQALFKHFPDWKLRWKIIRSLGPLRKAITNPDEPHIFFEVFGCSTRDAAKILRANCYVSRVPEPIRVAGLLARGLFHQPGNPPAAKARV